MFITTLNPGFKFFRVDIDFYGTFEQVLTLNPGFKFFRVDIDFYGTFEQVLTKVSVVSIISMIKIKGLVYWTDF